jgi:hypothetical protein
MVAEHPSELVRDQYAVQLAGRLDLDVDGMRSQVTRAAMEPRQEPQPQHRRSSRPEDPEHDAEPERVEPVRVDRRELDVLRWAVHEPQLVADWLDETLFLDPTARGAYDLLVSSQDMHEAIDAADGAVRQLLERLAVEEPVPDGEPNTQRARLMVSMVEPVAKRILARLFRDDDDRSMEWKQQLDLLAKREVGDWATAQEAAQQLVGWIVTDARNDAQQHPPAVPANPEATRVEQEA